MLCSLIYLSRVGHASAGHLTLEEQRAISEISKKNNAHDNITGVLARVGDYFLQYLEGDRSLLTNTFDRISQDQRHHQVTLVQFSELVRREFPNWQLEDATISDKESELMRSFTARHSFDPFALNAEAIHAILRDIYMDRRRAASGNRFLLEAVDSPPLPVHAQI